MENQNAIVLKQAPVISHQLKLVGESVTARLEELNVNSLVATPDTVKDLKKLRAELNKELSDYEEQRKFVKNGVNKPYLEFETLYKEEISTKYGDAITTLKSKIDEVEIKIKDEKKAVIESYFTELCQSLKIDFITFDQTGLKIDLSTTEKAYKEKVTAFIDKIQDDLLLISSMEFETEILVEYKKTLNASAAITAVNNRKEAEKQEALRLKEQAILNRKNALIKEGFAFDEFSQTYVYNEHIFCTLEEINTLEKAEFTEKFIKLQEEVKADKLAKLEAEKPIEKTSEGNYGVTYTAQAPKTEPLSAPVVETTEKTFSASFEVTGTMSQLNALKDFLITNNITYKNL